MRDEQEIIQAIRAILSSQMDAENAITSNDSFKFGYLIGRLNALNWVANDANHSSGEILIDRDYGDHQRESRIKVEDIFAAQDDMIERDDRHQAAIHEAAHLTVAKAMGKTTGRAWVNKSNTTDPENENTWTGQFAMFDDEWPAEIAVAGLAAEYRWREPGKVDAASIAELIETGCCEPSESDRAHFPPDDELAGTIEKALALLDKHQSFFDWAVAELMEGDDGGIVTDGMAREKFRELYG